jgi:protein lifeguard
MGKGDHQHHVEAGGGLCPYMIESPQLRWAFIRRVYVIVAMQMLVTVAAASAVYFVPAIRQFFAARTPAVLAAFVVIILAPIIGESHHGLMIILCTHLVIEMSFVFLHAYGYIGDGRQ